MTTIKTLKTFCFVIFSGFTILSCTSAEKFSVTGEVKNIERGKDGYTAVIATKDGKQYDAVISRVNMANTSEYQELSVGDNVTISGDTLNLGDRTSIKAESIKR